MEIKIKSESEIIEFLVPKNGVSFFRKTICFVDNPSICSINYYCFNFFKKSNKAFGKLAKAAERFGKGDYVNDFRASGAQEIRKAFEFDRMAKRINRHLNQRSEMLSGISHDLRTPLTRLKLQLAMLKQKNYLKNVSRH